MDNIIKVIFEEWQETQFDNTLTQWDYGHTLQVEGVTLPDGNIEVHFSLTDYDGEAPVYIGYVKNNVLTVEIPDFILQKENVYAATYEAYAWIYFTDGDFGKTKRKIVFTIEARAEPTTDIPEDKKEPFLDEVRKIMNETKEVAQSVRNDADAGKFNGKDGKDGKDGESGTSQIDEEQLLQFAIKSTTDPSPFHHITDSANYRVLDFGMEGITEQDTVPGNQLLPYPYGQKSDIFTDNGDGTVTVDANTTANGNQYYYLTGNTMEEALCLPAGTYTFSDAGCDDKSNRYSVAKWNDDGTLKWLGSLGKYTFNEDTKIRIALQLGHTNTIVNKTTYYPMLNSGSTALPWEPYVGGMPSPNPEHEEEIKLAGVYNEATGRYEIGCRVGNKNLFYKANENRATCDLSLASGTTITFSAENTYTQAVDIIYVYDTTEAIPLNLTTGVRKHSTPFVMKKDVKQIRFRATALEPQVEIGSLTDYTPHASQPLTLTSDRPLTKWDKLVKRDGVWGWSIWRLLISLDGNHNWRTYENDSRYVGFHTEIIPQLPTTNRRNGYCNQLRVNTQQTSLDDGLWIGADNKRLYLINSSFYDSTLEDKGLSNLKAHLNEYPLEIVTYADEEQSFHPLPENEQTLLNNLETYYGVTNVYNEQGCPMWLTYVNDTKLYVDKNLLEMQQAMI